ncbi:unnamed protein product, partial [marine sediment metagenome]
SDLIDTLTSKTVDGTVHSVFDHACNIQLDKNSLITLISPKLPNCPSTLASFASERPTERKKILLVLQALRWSTYRVRS